MEPLYDYQAPKKTIYLILNSELLNKSRALNINLSATLEQVLWEKLAWSKVEQWRGENKKAIRSNNDFVDKVSCFEYEYREF